VEQYKVEQLLKSSAPTKFSIVLFANRTLFDLMLSFRKLKCRPPLNHLWHTFRGDRNLRLSANGGTLEHAQQIAAHQSLRTKKLNVRTTNEISLDEVEAKSHSKAVL